jgi:thiosulfate/3-mercaptopyruvate sulfurtransferase
MTKRDSIYVVFVFFVLLAFVKSFAIGAAASDPWTKSQVFTPQDLQQRLREAKGTKPLILHVGFRSLYDQGHIPGSQYHGPASLTKGLGKLRKGAATLPRNREIILYCGCCPWYDCPNIRPAFRALKEMGFTRLRVLSLPTSFAVDWAGKGYPNESTK